LASPRPSLVRLDTVGDGSERGSEHKPTGAIEYIRVRGARTHNLKNISLDLPRNRLVV